MPQGTPLYSSAQRIPSVTAQCPRPTPPPAMCQGDDVDGSSPIEGEGTVMSHTVHQQADVDGLSVFYRVPLGTQ
jgi:hypothetical protein